MSMSGTQKKQEGADPAKVERLEQGQQGDTKNDVSIHVKHITPFTLDPVTMGLKKDDKLESVLQENKKLRIANKQLRKQLEVFQKRLDETLKKRTVSEKKPRVAKEVVQSMELKNAYKQCEIYKKEIFQLKKKQALFDEQKLHNLTNQISQYQIQKQKLLQEIKSLKKLNKQQEKGLVELTGNTSFVKVLREVEQLKEENKKLLEKQSKQDRETKLTKITVNNQKRRAKEEEIKNSEQKKKQEEKQASQVQILKQKADKDGRKIILLISDNNKLTSQCQELRRQIDEKDKEVSALRLRLGVLRKEARIKHSRLETEPNKIQKQQQGMNTHRSKNTKHDKHKSEMTDSQFIKQPVSDSKQQSKKTFVKYPKLLETGVKKQNSVKWNHHQFSSKIKEVQVATHPNGHIGEINFRYEKGQPAPTGVAKSNFIKFVCQQNTGEYVKNIKGGFKQELLMYIKVETNKGRIQKIGKLDSEPQCTSFTFGELDSEYPGGFFGEISEEGINRLGCLLQCIK